MADEKKKMNFDLENLDLSDLGTTVSVENENSNSDEEEFVDKSNKSQKIQSGCWLNHKPIEDVTHDEMATWISSKYPGTDSSGFNKSAFSSVSKRELAVSKVIDIYDSISYLFPVKNKLKEYSN